MGLKEADRFGERAGGGEVVFFCTSRSEAREPYSQPKNPKFCANSPRVSRGDGVPSTCGVGIKSYRVSRLSTQTLTA